MVTSLSGFRNFQGREFQIDLLLIDFAQQLLFVAPGPILCGS